VSTKNISYKFTKNSVGNPVKIPPFFPHFQAFFGDKKVPDLAGLGGFTRIGKNGVILQLDDYRTSHIILGG
jgi:hypothetical protein